MRYPGRLVSASPYLPRAPSSLTAAQDTTPFTRKFASRYVLLPELCISLPPSYLCLPSLLVLRPCPPVLRRCLGWDRADTVPHSRTHQINYPRTSQSSSHALLVKCTSPGGRPGRSVSSRRALPCSLLAHTHMPHSVDGEHAKSSVAKLINKVGRWTSGMYPPSYSCS